MLSRIRANRRDWRLEDYVQLNESDTRSLEAILTTRVAKIVAEQQAWMKREVEIEKANSKEKEEVEDGNEDDLEGKGKGKGKGKDRRKLKKMKNKKNHPI